MARKSRNRDGVIYAAVSAWWARPTLDRLHLDVLDSLAELDELDDLTLSDIERAAEIARVVKGEEVVE